VLFLKKYDAPTTAAIQAIKTQTQDKLFAEDALGAALETLIEEKKVAIKRGDAVIQRIENDLVAKLDALAAQDNLTAADKRELKAEAKGAITSHKESDAYKEWLQTTSDDYNERLENLRETLADDFLAQVKAQVEDYDVFMAIAEDIGYDAANRPTGKNQLPLIAQHLSRFLEDPLALKGCAVRSRSIIGDRLAIGLSGNIFIKSARHLFGFRFDARVHSCDFCFDSKSYPLVALRSIASINPTTRLDDLSTSDEVTFVPMEVVDDEYGEITAPFTKLIGERIGYTRFSEGDLLWAKITPCMENGKSAVARNLLNGRGLGSTEFHVVRVQPAKLDVDYLHALLRLPKLRVAAMLFFGGSAGHQRVDKAFLRNLEIPLPSLSHQKEIAQTILKERKEAKKLREDARKKLAHSIQLIGNYVEQ